MENLKLEKETKEKEESMKRLVWLVLALFVCIATSVSAVEVTASSVEIVGLEPWKVCDGDHGTRWSSAFAKNQWLMLDFEEVRWIGEVKIKWENAYATFYTIDISIDGINWTTVYTQSEGCGGVEVCRLAMFDEKVEVMYVRINLIERFNKDWGFSMFEVEAR